MPVIRLALAQMNTVVGGFAQNVETLGRFRTQAAAAGADLVLSPELALTGYPPEDLLLKEGFIAATGLALEELALDLNLPPLLVGTVVAEGAYGVKLVPSSDGRDLPLTHRADSRAGHIANALVAISERGTAGVL